MFAVLLREDILSIRILLADDQRIVCDSLRAILEELEETEVVGQAADGQAVLEEVRRLLPDVVVMEIALPLLNGVEATHALSQDYPHVKVLCVSGRTDSDSVYRMLRAGAKGFLPKDCLPEELVQAVRTLAAGGVYISPSIGRAVLANLVRGRGEDGVVSTLSHREKRIVQLLSEGETTRQVGRYLHISGKTVAAHRRVIAQKLQIRGAAELTKFAIRNGLSAALLRSAGKGGRYCFGSGVVSPCRMAYRVSSATLSMPSLRVMLRRWVSTVLGLILRSRAISLVAKPSASRWSICLSRGVSAEKTDTRWPVLSRETSLIDGLMYFLPEATVRTASSSSSNPQLFGTYPEAPALNMSATNEGVRCIDRAITLVSGSSCTI